MEIREVVARRWVVKMCSGIGKCVRRESYD